MDESPEALRPDPIGGRADSLEPVRIATLYLEHGAELRRFLLGVLRDPDRVSDVLQATFVKAIESGHQARSESLKAWLFRVALNEALVTRRRTETGDRITRKLAAWSRTGDRPEESLIRGETVEHVRRVLETLPAAQREVVRMRIYEEKTFARIADELGLPLGTVLTRMRLALDKMRQGLGERGEHA